MNDATYFAYLDALPKMNVYAMGVALGREFGLGGKEAMEAVNRWLLARRGY